MRMTMVKEGTFDYEVEKTTLAVGCGDEDG